MPTIINNDMDEKIPNLSIIQLKKLSSWYEKTSIPKYKVKEIIEKFAKESDVDGRNILFQFTDTDLRDLLEKIGR